MGDARSGRKWVAIAIGALLSRRRICACAGLTVVESLETFRAGDAAGR